MKNYYIYGAGSVAQITYLHFSLSHPDINISGFIVTSRDSNPSKLFGLDVYEYNQFKAFCNTENSFVFVAVQSNIQPLIASGLERAGYSYQCIEFEALILNFYSQLYQEDVVKNKVLASNMHGLGFGGNPKYVIEKLLEKGKGLQLDIVWALQGGVEGNIPDTIRTVEIGTLDFYKELATSRLWISNARMPIAIRKREGQFYLQTWHGGAPGKKVEADIIEHLPQTYICAAQNDSRMADLFLSDSKFYTTLFQRAFWYSGEILEVGLPREDVFWHKEEIKQHIYQILNISEDKKAALYAPTFRDDYSTDGYQIDLSAVVKALENKFGKRFQLLVSKHPENRNIIYPFEGEIDYIDVWHYPDFEEILAASDVLITDYSGCAYDFALSGNPVFLFQSDYEKYAADRGFYLDQGKLPFSRAFSNQQLIENILDFDEKEYKQDVDSFLQGLGVFADGHASDKVADYLVKIIKQ